MKLLQASLALILATLAASCASGQVTTPSANALIFSQRNAANTANRAPLYYEDPGADRLLYWNNTTNFLGNATVTGPITFAAGVINFSLDGLTEDNAPNSTDYLYFRNILGQPRKTRTVDLFGNPFLSWYTGRSQIGAVDTAFDMILIYDSDANTLKLVPPSSLLSGVGVTDGNKGDITVASSGTAWTINAGAYGVADFLGSQVSPAIAWDLSAATFELPNSNTPTVNVAGQLAFDLDGDGVNLQQGVLKGYDGTNTLYFIGVDTLPTTGGTFLRYNSSTNKAEFAAIPGGGDMLSTNNLSDLTSASSARSNLGGTTIGGNLFTLTNPSIAGFVRINADNTVTARTYANAKMDLSLDAVENTALSTWTGAATVTTVGTIGTGTWQGTAITPAYGGTGQTSVIAGDMLYGTGVNTIGKLQTTSSGRAYLQAVDGTLNAAGVTNGSVLDAWGAVEDSNGLAGQLDDETGSGGGFVRATAPTIADPVLTGAITQTNAVPLYADTAMGALAVDVTKRWNTKTVATDSVLTFSATPAAGTVFGVEVTNSDSSGHVITIPSSYVEGFGTSVTTFTLPAGAKASIDWRYNGTIYTAYGVPWTILDYSEDATPDSAGSFVYQEADGDYFRTTIADALAAVGATAWDAIGNPSGNGSISFGTTQQNILSTLDSGTILEIGNTDADAAADTISLKLSHNDGADANVIYLRMVGDADGTPTNDYTFSQTGFTSLLPVNVPAEAYDATGWNGDTGAPQKDAVRDKIESLTGADIDVADTGSIFTGADVEAVLLELAKVPVKTTASSYTVGTTNPRELFGGVIYVTGAATITIPAVADGASFTVITIGAVAVSVDPNASDLIYLDGIALDDGDKVTNTSTAGDIAVFTYFGATGWYAATNSWTDGGP